MTKQEKKAIIDEAAKMTDAELESEYYDTVFDSLGSLAEEMYERGYDMADIREREAYEKFISQKADLLEQLCMERGISLWQKGA